MYRPSPLLAPLLYIPGLFFEAAVRVRNHLYSAGMLTAARLPRPVISVGNLTLGGSGKTPLVIHVGRTLAALGCTPAILSRGYGRAGPSRPLILSPGETVPDPVPSLGDEPTLIRRHLPGAWLGVAPDRYAAGLRIVERCRNTVFVLDDAFQHRRIHRDLDIVIIDRTQPLAENRVFPRGSLREPPSSLARSGIVVLNGRTTGPGNGEFERMIRKISPSCSLFHCSQKIDSLVPFDVWNGSERRDCGPHGYTRVFVVSALGNPARFLADVRESGVGVAGHRFYRDHHRLTGRDWDRCVAEARSAGAEALVITEKDAVKAAGAPDFPLLVAVQSTHLENQPEFDRGLARIMGGAR